MDESVELHAIVRGEVQGVCFRAAAQRHAQALGLTGSARNCVNGSVEVIAQGQRKDLDRLLAAIKKNPGYGRVDAIEATYRPIQQPIGGFHIK